MTGPELSTALQTLGLDTQAAAKWLGVSVRAVQRYRVSGAPGPVAAAIAERDKADCLECELQQAALVAYLRGAKEWAVSNYPRWKEWLESHDAYGAMPK